MYLVRAHATGLRVLGDVDGDDIFGDGVNVAARVENECEPGGTFSDDWSLAAVTWLYEHDAAVVDVPAEPASAAPVVEPSAGN